MAEAPAASSGQQQTGEGGGWAAHREAERRRQQDVTARAAAAKQQLEGGERSASPGAEVLVAAEPAAAEAAAEPQAAAETAAAEPQAAAEPAAAEAVELQAAAGPAAAEAVEDVVRQEPAQPAAVGSQQGRKPVAAGRSVAGSPEPRKAGLSKRQLKRLKEAAFRRNKAETKKRDKEARRSASLCSAPIAEPQPAAAAEAATKGGELVRGLSVKAELLVEQAACVAATMEAAEPAAGAEQAAGPAAGSALLPQDLPATGQPAAQEAAGVGADKGPAAASISPEPAALVPAAASSQASQQVTEAEAAARQLQEAGRAALARPLQAGRDSDAAGIHDEGPDLAAPPAARTTLETGAEVAAAPGSHAPQLAAEASLARQLQPEGASGSQGDASSVPPESEAQAAVGVASLASVQGSSEVMAKRHDQTDRDLSLASQLQQERDSRASGVSYDAGQVHWGGKEKVYPSPAKSRCARSASCCALPTAHSDGSCAHQLADVSPTQSAVAKCSVHSWGSAAVRLPCRWAQHQAAPSGTTGQWGPARPAGAPARW